MTCAYYVVTAVTPEDGRISITTRHFERARKMHSLLMNRQLNPNDMTHDVKVRTTWY